MERVRILLDRKTVPEIFYKYFEGANIYDSSCSQEAKVIYIDKDGGYFLKKAEKGSLETEALMTDYFYKKGLSAEVVEYFSGETDYLLTRRIKGEDCISEPHLDAPVRLCDTVSSLLRVLHETSFEDCPVKDRNKTYFETVESNFNKGIFSREQLPEKYKTLSKEEAFHLVQTHKKFFKNDVLLHGDYCLPNIILDDFKFKGFIDLGAGGVGDRHIDLFWGAWSLKFNLKTDKYRERFFDGYGRDKIIPEMIDIVDAAESFG